MNVTKKLHFMHIPKTGGTSLHTFLERQFNFAEICPAYFLYYGPKWSENIKPFCRYSINEIRDYNFFRHHLGWIPRMHFLNEEIETITFLRDPIERTLSEFDHIVRDDQSFPLLSKRWEKVDDYLWDPIFDDFYKANIQTRSFCADFYLDYNPNPSHPLAKEFVHLPFGKKIEIDSGKLLQKALERLHNCAFVGITEQFEKSLDILCSKYSWIKPNTVEKLNVASKRTNKTNLSPKVLDRIEEINQLDSILYTEAVKMFSDRNRKLIAVSPFKKLKSISPFKKKKNLKEKPTHLLFTFAEKFVGDYWHSREIQNGMVFCWNNHTLSTILLDIKFTGDLMISFHILHFIVPELKQTLTLNAHSHQIPLSVSEHPKGGYYFEGVIPHFLANSEGKLELSFSIGEVKRPIDVIPGNKDVRLLGFACHSIELKPDHPHLFTATTHKPPGIKVSQYNLQPHDKAPPAMGMGVPPDCPREVSVIPSNCDTLTEHH